MDEQVQGESIDVDLEEAAEELRAARRSEGIPRIALLMRSLGRAKAQLQALEQAKAAEIATIEAEYADCLRQAWKRLELRESWLAEVEDIVRAGLEGRKERSLKVGRWRLGFRKQPERLAVADGAEASCAMRAAGPQMLPTLLSWAVANHPEAVKVNYSLLVSGLPKDLDVAQVPDGGIEVVPERETFYWKDEGGDQ